MKILSRALISYLIVFNLVLVLCSGMFIDKAKMKNLAEISEDEQLQFINSFDFVLSDMDGVLWTGYNAIPGAVSCISNLQKLGKRVSFVTNNGAKSPEEILGHLRRNNISANLDNVVNPVVAYISVLKEQRFNKTIFLIGSEKLRVALTNAGFKIAPNPPHPIEDEYGPITANFVDDKEIGAVILDYDTNLTLLKLQKAIIYLKRSDCLFIVGTSDKSMSFPPFGRMPGNLYFYDILKDLSGRKAQHMAKPAPDYCEFVRKRFSITNPKRVLFIGDTVTEDMEFGTNCGYQKLLVFTGVAKKEDLLNWKYNENCKPDYYIESLDGFNSIIKNLQKRI